MFDITFCPDRKCKYTECLRHNNNAPRGILISRFSEKPKLDKEGKCEEYLK